MEVETAEKIERKVLEFLTAERADLNWRVFQEGDKHCKVYVKTTEVRRLLVVTIDDVDDVDDYVNELRIELARRLADLKL